MVKKDSSIAAIILSEDKTKILLIKRRDIPVWVMPGGGIDEGETSTQAVLREIKEETGCEAIILRLVAIYQPSNKMTKKTYFYECKLLEEDFIPNDEASKICFFPLKDLPYRLPPPYPEWIEDALSNQSHPIEKTIHSVTYKNLIKHSFKHPILVVRFILSRMGIHLNF